MKALRSHTAWLTILLILTGTGVRSARQPDSAELSEPTMGPKTAVLPLENLSGDSRAYELSTTLVYANLTELNVDFISAEDLRPILRRYRIRAAGRIAPNDARAIATETGAEVLLVGAIDFFRQGDNPEIGLSLRLVSPVDMVVRTAVSDAATASGQLGLFGTGKIDSIDVLAPSVVAAIVGELYAPWRGAADGSAVTASVRAVVLPFDNISEDRRAGSIAANWLLAELVGRGFTVSEPGAIAELLRPHGGLPVGQIDYPRLNLIRGELGADIIITGQVDRFKPARSSSPSARPEFEFGARIIDAASGRIIAAYNAEHDGGQSESVFRLGRRYALGKLIQHAFKETMDYFKPRMASYALE